MYRRIIVPLDGSLLAELALPEAEQLARLMGAPIHLLRVVDLTQLPWYGPFSGGIEFVAVEQALSEDAETAASYLQTVAERLTAAGLPAITEVRRGQTARVVEEATKPGDVIVMASHGRSGMTRWFLGSVAEEILRHADVPILLVKAEEERAAMALAAPLEVQTAEPLVVAS